MTANSRSRRYAVFDLETAADIPEGDEWQDHRPMGITCAALYAPELGEPVTWHGVDGEGEIAGRMSREELALMARQLTGLRKQGFTIVTWNGLGFDFDVLAEESGLGAKCRRLALEHVDMMFHVLCKLGYPLGLETAATGMKLAGKTEGMDGGRRWDVARGTAGGGDRVLRPGRPMHLRGGGGRREDRQPPVDQPLGPGPEHAAAGRLAHGAAGDEAAQAGHRLDDRSHDTGAVHPVAGGLNRPGDRQPGTTAREENGK